MGLKPVEEDFVRATGGGKGAYHLLPKGAESEKKKIFRQQDWSQGASLGYGRISFAAPANDPKLYLRIPHTADSNMVLHFVESVWNLPRPKLLVGITGGAVDFHISGELESVLNQLMQIALDTDAWIFTGGTRGGIMKYFGAIIFLIVAFCSFRVIIMFAHRSSPISFWGEYSLDRLRNLGFHRNA